MNIFDLLTRLLPIVKDVSAQLGRRSGRRQEPEEEQEEGEAGGEEPENLPAPAARAQTVERPRELPRVANVVATEFLTATDDRNGATAQQPAYTWAPRYYKGCGRTLFGAAVPMKVSEGDKIRIRRIPAEGSDPGPWYIAPIIDKGPHHTTDEYLLTGDRPAAENEDGNRAGVDVTPPLMAKLLQMTTEAAYLAERSCVVEVQLIRAITAPKKDAPTGAAARAVEAARSLPRPFPYAPETNAGELGCAQVISTALVNARQLSRVRLAVVDLRKDIEAAGWRKVTAGAALKPADVVIWGPTKGGTHKHTGMITVGSPGPLVLHNSSAERRVVERPLTTVTRPVEVILRRP